MSNWEGESIIERPEKSRKWGEGNYFLRGPGLPKKRCLVFTHNKSVFRYCFIETEKLLLKVL